jgi:hypothetical protein
MSKDPKDLPPDSDEGSLAVPNDLWQLPVPVNAEVPAALPPEFRPTYRSQRMALPESKKREKEIARIMKQQPRFARPPPAKWGARSSSGNSGFPVTAPSLPCPSQWAIPV